MYYFDLFCTWFQAAYACGHSLVAATFDCRHTSCCGWPMLVFLYVLESFQQVSPADCHWQIQRRSQSVKKEWNQSSRFLKDRMVLLCAPCPRCLKGTTIAVSGTERLTANSLSTEGRSFEPKPQTLSLRSVSCASDFRPTSGTKSGTSQTTAPCQTLHGLALKPRGF